MMKLYVMRLFGYDNRLIMNIGGYWRRSNWLFEDNTMFRILEENGAIKKAREMAKKLLELGVSLEIVKEGSGLSDSELLEIQQSIGQMISN